MKQASFRVLPLLLVLLGLATAALADCDDYPGPGVDWSGCDKSRRLLAEDDFHGANLSRADLSYAYPFASLNYVLVLLSAWWLLGEQPSPTRMIGVVVICFGGYL